MAGAIAPGGGNSEKAMEIGISRKGDLTILSVKGKLRVQHWRILDKHLDAMLGNGLRWVALDLSGTTLLCSTGIGSLMHNVRKFQEHEAHLLLVATTPYVQELFQLFGCGTYLSDNVFNDWHTLEKRLQGQGLALTGP